MSAQLARSAPPAGGDEVAEQDAQAVTFLRRDGHAWRVVRRRDGSERRSRLAACAGPDGPLDSATAELALLTAASSPSYAVGSAAVPFVDLFAGLGSLSLGVMEAARALHLRPDLRLAADFDVDALRVLRASLAAPSSVARRLNVTRHIRAAPSDPVSDAERKLVDRVGNDLRLLVAGPPCQGHSTLNNASRHDDVRNHLYMRVVRLAELTRPEHVLIENVAAIESDRRRSVEKAIEALERLDYRVDHRLVNLHDLGLPQRRKRHVLVASAGGTRRLTVDGILHAHRVGDPAERTVKWAIGDLADIDGTGFDGASTPSPDNRRRIDWLHAAPGRVNLPNHLRPPCHRGQHTYKSMYGKLAWDEPAQTITSGYGSMGQGRYVHPEQPRTLTPHEAARLQMLPDFYDFSSVTRRGSWAQMIGNAAPWKLAFAFAVEALR